MFARVPGAGSLYSLCARDHSGAYLDGAISYRLGVPLPVPDKLFWSITVYDALTRAEIVTDQNLAALRSLVELPADQLGDASTRRGGAVASRRSGSRSTRVATALVGVYSLRAVGCVAARACPAWRAAGLDRSCGAHWTRRLCGAPCRAGRFC